MKRKHACASGVDLLLRAGGKAIKGRSIAILTNATGVTRDLASTVDALVGLPDVRLRALFGPEHGIQGAAQDAQPVVSSVDSRTGVPVYSLFDDHLAPTSEMLDGIDLIIYDIQDIGVRYYTYIYTMVYALRAAARQGVGFMVLDRPNPLGGQEVEGNVVAPGFESFVGALPLAIRHGMTAGEIAMMANGEEGLGAELEVIPVENWQRSLPYLQTGLPWVQPSPNMPTLDTVLVYPGTCLLEGANLSEGRGTTRPFEIFGSPWVSAFDLARHLNAKNLPGACFRPVVFMPAFSNFDLLMGADDVRHRLEAGEDVSRIVESWAPSRRSFMQVREKYLIYEE
ncbi:MAG: DUF1343 domain-containing protein [Firmicutes bacterium]|nr:DUF1343 domain-containing protein [Bacillota bacterium]